MTLFAGALLVLLWRQQQVELSDSLQDTARAVSLAVDREIESTIKRLEVLSNEESLRAERWAEFHRETARLVAVSDDWTNLLVFSDAGHALVNVAIPGGKPLPQYDVVEYVQSVIDEGRPTVSDLFVSPTTGKLVVHVAVPVVRPGQPTLVLSASLDIDGLDRLVLDQAGRSEGIASIFDRNLRIVARSRSSDQYVGMQPAVQLRDAMLAQTTGTGRVPMHDDDVYAAWTRSELTDWWLVFGVPSAPAEAALRSSLTMLGSVGLIVLLMTVFIALHISRRVAGIMAQATRSAMALAKGEPLPAMESGITELTEFGDALGRADRILKKESEERARAEAERELLFEREQQAREQAEAAGRAKDEFLAMLGHELRNPLAPILFAVELAKVHDGVPRRELEIIERQARHIERLVNDLLDIARIVRGKVSLNKKVEELHPIVSKAVEIAEPLLEAKQHVLTLDVPKQGLPVEADETRLAQVIANLLTNAAKFTAPGGQISVSAERAGDEVLVRVRDSGIGIAPELLPNVFDIFTQGKRSNEHAQGLGLGLALVRSFVRLHGGTVEAHSEGLGHGSEFTVRLPAVEAEPVVGAVAGPSSSTAAIPARVLVVDDNVDAADSLGELLRVHGYQVATANDGRRALELARSFQPQLAIIDLGMPVMDGYQVAQELSRTVDRPFLIAVTGYGQEHDRERSQAAGFDRHMIKPVAIAQLLAYIEEALASARA